MKGEKALVLVAVMAPALQTLWEEIKVECLVAPELRRRGVTTVAEPI